MKNVLSGTEVRNLWSYTVREKEKKFHVSRKEKEKKVPRVHSCQLFENVLQLNEGKDQEEEDVGWLDHLPNQRFFTLQFHLKKVKFWSICHRI